MESDKQAAPVSAGEVKRWGLVVRQGHALMDVVENGQWIPVADHLSAMKAMQERIATLEAERDVKQKLLDDMPCNHPRNMMLVSAETGKDLFCWICDLKGRMRDTRKETTDWKQRAEIAESELAAYKASLPERAKRAANIFGGSPSAIHQLAAIILAEMQREKE